LWGGLLAARERESEERKVARRKRRYGGLRILGLRCSCICVVKNES
jgi:hypothetical protein